MKRTAKRFINRIVRPWGMELAYAHQIIRPDYEAMRWLRDLDIRTVLDVGANVGQFAAEIARTLPEARIISFEPLRDAYSELAANLAAGAEAHNFALGSEDGSAVITRARNSQSSSLLPMLDLHREAFAGTEETGTEEIIVKRLDSLRLDIESNLLVKLDVQGFEDQVIAGGRETISRASCVITEVSFERLYAGQPLFDDINRELQALGFRYGGNCWQLPDQRSGRILQADAIFTKPDGTR